MDAPEPKLSKYNTLRNIMLLDAWEMIKAHQVCVAGGNNELANIYTHRLVYLSTLYSKIYPESLPCVETIDSLKILPTN